jgi:hypothetical protein
VSGDIDIALDDMLGKTFCRKLVGYLRDLGIESNGFGVIRRYVISPSTKTFRAKFLAHFFLVSFQFADPLSPFLENLPRI